MGILSAAEVYRRIKKGEPIVEPFEYVDEHTPPASIDIRFSAKIMNYSFQEDYYMIGESDEELEKPAEPIDADVLDIQPGAVAILIIHERISIPNDLVGIILPRSSLSRLGIFLQPTFINPGYTGNFPVPIVNNSNIKIGIPFKDGVSPRLAQLILLPLTSQPHRLYGEGIDEKYHEEEGIPARFDKDIDMRKLLAGLKKSWDQI
jgi:dCTP deaminase